MSIVFFCTACGARFEVGDAAAGKVGRCKKCGEKNTIPKTTAKAATAAASGPNGPGWLEHMSSQVALAPMTIDRIPGVRTRSPNAPPIDEDLGDSKPYAVVTSWKIPAVEAARSASGPAGKVTITWRHWLGNLAKFFRRLNEFAYLLSVPFLMLLMIGAAMHNRGLALLGAQAVVLLNLGRIVTGMANILAVPFREGLTTGLLFLVPPFTIKYMIDHWNRLKRPTQRVVTPLLTIVAVVLVFAFLPSLSAKSDGKKAGDQPKSMILGR